MRKWTGTAVVIAAVLVAWPTPAGAQAADLSIPIETSISGGYAVGEQVDLVSIAITDLAGRECAVRSVRRDPQPANRGNDLIVSSGETDTTLVDVEAAPAVTGESMITLGDTLTVAIEIGPDERFSAGVDVELDCAAGQELAAFGAEATAPGPSADGDGLPITGSVAAPVGAIGAALLMAGAALWFLARVPDAASIAGRPEVQRAITRRRTALSARRRPGRARS